ncbi:MAG: hypothetical protein IPH16_12975 [Haliscomenobacter sp.]|nr:hypothetical protein [Haliscomenobacter sp.]
MKYRFSLLSLLLFLLPALAFSQVVLEDFEGGAKLTWNAKEGAFSVVDNPAGGDTLKINSSAKVGQYTKNQALRTACSKPNWPLRSTCPSTTSSGSW